MDSINIIDDNNGGSNSDVWNVKIGKVTERLLSRQEKIDDIGKDVIKREAISLLSHCTEPVEKNNSDTGIAIGYVQSGKTLSFTTVLALAADNGYRVAVILTGTKNNLLSQTTSRLISDLEIHGANSKVLKLPVSTDKSQLHRWLRIPIKPLIIIPVLKHFKHIAELAAIFKSSEITNVLGKNAAIIIDDEADHASVNTNKEHLDPTTINRKITELLGIFPKNAYVGYTATPFANVFINPGETDIFPEDFIFTLDTPSNYFGPEKVFGLNERSDIVKPIPFDEYEKDEDDYCPYIPLKHKKDHDLDDLPPSLEDAIIVFMLSCATRNLKGQINQHKTMMINVSVYKNVQHSVRLLAHQLVIEIKEAVSANFALRDALDDYIIRRFHKLWKQEFPDIRWEDILKELSISDLKIKDFYRLKIGE